MGIFEDVRFLVTGERPEMQRHRREQDEYFEMASLHAAQVTKQSDDRTAALFCWGVAASLLAFAAALGILDLYM